MKNILLPFEYAETIPHLIDCAVSLAKVYKSSISGVAIHQRIDSFIAQEGSIIFDTVHHDENISEVIKYKEKFESHMEGLVLKDKALSSLNYQFRLQD